MVVGLVLAAVYVTRTRSLGTAAIPPVPVPAAVGPAPAPPSAAPAAGGAAVLEAFKARRSGVEVEATGVVARRLADDRKGLPHERFILRVGDLTVLIAHRWTYSVIGLREGSATLTANRTLCSH